MAEDNRTLGRFHLDGHPAGAARRAADRGHVRHRRQRHPQRLGQGHGDRQGAADHHHRVVGPEQAGRRADGEGGRGPRREDAQRRQEIELRNQTDALVYSTERALAEHGAKLSDAERASVEQALSEAREALKAEDAERIRQRPGRPDARLPDARRGDERPSRRRRRRAPAVGGLAGGDVVDAEFKDVETGNRERGAAAMRVEDVMTRTLVTVPPETSVLDAQVRLTREGFGTCSSRRRR